MTNEATTPVSTSATSTVAQDAIEDITIIKQAIAAYKGGGKAALVALLSSIIPTVKKDIEDIKQAIPEIKAGYKTTEFWLVVGVVALNGGYTAATGKTLPFDTNAVLGTVVAVYTVVRGLIKK